MSEANEPGIHNPYDGVRMLNSNAGVMDSGPALSSGKSPTESAHPGMTKKLNKGSV